MKPSGIFVGSFLLAFCGAGAGVFVANQVSRPSAPPVLVASEDRTESAQVRPADFLLTPSESGVGADFRAPAKKLTNAVVSIDKIQAVRRNFFDESVTMRQTGTGSGVIISTDGLIVTNAHVVEGASSIVVRLSDGRNIPGKILGADRRSDIALVKINAQNLTAAPIAKAKPEVGEWVLAVGNPLGYSHTVSVGVVSSLGRTLSADGSSVLVDAIQTDAAINQGNSGGALANSRGELVGINSAIASNTGGSIGIGFAIPVGRALRVVKELQKDGRVRYGSLGERLYGASLEYEPVRQELASLTNAQPPAKGVILRATIPNSPLAQLGLTQFDVITDIDGKPIVNPTDLEIALADKRAGEQVTVGYWSRGSAKKSQVTLSDMLGRRAADLEGEIAL